MKRLLSRSPVPSVFEQRQTGALRALAYHGVPRRKSFERQVDLLLDRYAIVSIDQVEAWIHEGHSLPASSVLITFDDGDVSVHDNALPVLRDAGLPAVAYVVADLIDTSTPFWWDEATALADAASGPETVRRLKTLPDEERRMGLDAMRRGRPPVTARQLTRSELKAMSDGGMAVGNHTSSHPCLDRCDHCVVRSEIENAHARLAELVGRAPATFAYPNGNLDARAEPVLRELGYRSGFLFDHRVQVQRNHPLRISRLRVDASSDVDTFRLMVSGAHSFIHHRVMRRS